jgi:hypothetical protein
MVMAGYVLVMTALAQAQPQGTLKWSYTAANAITACGAALDGNQTAYFSDWQHGMYAINADSSTKWSVSSGYNYTGDNSAALSQDGQTVYFLIYTGGISARSTSNGNEVWHYINATAATFPALWSVPTARFISTVRQRFMP